MHNVRVILTNGSFQFTKDFQLSTVPQVDWIVNILIKAEGGYVSARVKRISQYLDEDVVKVWCDTELRALCQLYRNNQEWTVNDLADFETSSAVNKMIAKIKRDET